MQSIVLIAEEGLHLDRLRSLLPQEWKQHLIANPADTRFVKLEGPQHEWFIHILEAVEYRDLREDDYWTNDLLDLEFRESLGGNSFFSVSFSNYFVMRALLPSLLRVFEGRLEKYWIDNDYGVVIRADRFLAKLEGDSSWDWRTKNP